MSIPAWWPDNGGESEDDWADYACGTPGSQDYWPCVACGVMIPDHEERCAECIEACL